MCDKNIKVCMTYLSFFVFCFVPKMQSKKEKYSPNKTQKENSLVCSISVKLA